MSKLHTIVFSEAVLISGDHAVLQKHMWISMLTVLAFWEENRLEAGFYPLVTALCLQ